MYTFESNLMKAILFFFFSSLKYWNAKSLEKMIAGQHMLETQIVRLMEALMIITTRKVIIKQSYHEGVTIIILLKI